MTVKELRELTKEAPDDMIVYIGAVTELGAFMFQPACSEVSGPVDFGPPVEGTDYQGRADNGFVIMPHGISRPADEPEEKGPSTILN